MQYSIVEEESIVVSCNYIKLQQFQRSLSKLAGKGEYYRLR